MTKPPRLTSNQRRAQANAVSQAIKDEAERISKDLNIAMDAAFAQVYNDPEKLAKCQQKAPAVEEMPKDWKEPE
jgi:enolase